MENSDAASRTPHDRKTSMFDFLFASHDGLLVVVSGEASLPVTSHMSWSANDDWSGSSL